MGPFYTEIILDRKLGCTHTLERVSVSLNISGELMMEYHITLGVWKAFLFIIYQGYPVHLWDGDTHPHLYPHPDCVGVCMPA